MDMMYTELDRYPLVKVGYLSVYKKLRVIRIDIKLDMSDRNFFDINFGQVDDGFLIPLDRNVLFGRISPVC